jgi:hypothetical protein
MVNTAVHKVSFDPDLVAEGNALWAGLVRQLGR